MAVIEEQAGPSRPLQTCEAPASSSGREQVSSGGRNIQVAPVNPMVISEQEDRQLAEAMRLSEMSIQPQLSLSAQQEKLLPYIEPYFPGANAANVGETVKEVYSILDKESSTLRQKKLAEFSGKEFSDFVFERFAVRRISDKGRIQGLLNASMTFSDLISLFKDYNVAKEKELRGFLQSKDVRCNSKNTTYYRVGSYCTAQDELGRCQRAKRRERIFEEETVNVQRTAFGYGLYVATTKAAAKSYLGQGYNKQNPVCILEIRLKDKIPIAAFHYIENSIVEAVKNDKCHVTGVLYQQRKKECLIKDENIISSVKAFHTDIRTKLAIPFSKDEISNKALFTSPIKKEMLDRYSIGYRKIGAKCVIDPFSGNNKKELLEYAFKVANEVRESSEYKYKYEYEYKYYFQDQRGDCIRVKPAAEINGKISHRDQFEKFLVQYKWPKNIENQKPEKQAPSLWNKGKFQVRSFFSKLW
ncbi:hypothetical protein [Endozoicomonas ascidiicola]|uniref:hypothetical protein n=1 Tax=Endozoicomonas ascidiicola TaxID=1698521 RepID=UPI000830A391|nr:hypothetical protein [Endozoicomonas ascidiicola]